MSAPGRGCVKTAACRTPLEDFSKSRTLRASSALLGAIISARDGKGSQPKEWFSKGSPAGDVFTQARPLADYRCSLYPSLLSNTHTLLTRYPKLCFDPE